MRRKVLVGMLFICTMILFLCAFISSVSASTLYVPDDYSTIEDIETPGFEAAFAIAGLLAVAYILRRNRR